MTSPALRISRLSAFRIKHLSTRSFSFTARIMSSKQEWMVIIPDKSGMLAKRMEVRTQHLSAAQKSSDDGFVLFGGASLDEPITEGKPLGINGSVMLVTGDSQEEVIERLKKDIYVESGVWDMEKAQIFPFKSAIRNGL